MSLTRGHSCVVCQQRKVRCDQQKPCANCVRSQVECKIAPPQPPRRRRRKLNERDLLERLKKYETIMTENGVSFRSAFDDQDEASERQDSSSITKQIPRGQGNRRRNLKWFAYYDEYRSTDDLLEVSTDEEQDQPTIHHAFDTMFSDFDTFPFMVGGAPTPITHLHPSAIQIFQLWQVYLDNVNPILKICHAPSLQVQIVGAGAKLARIPGPLEALMFSVYLIAVRSMTDEEVQRTLGESKSTILDQYYQASQQALVNVGFMRSNDLMVLQAFLLCLLGVGRNVDPRSLFCLIGIAVRIATRLGLHRDGARFGLSPFEAEQRRRTWWQLVAFDKRIAEMTGSPITAISSCGSECRLPLNVNDSDLHPDSRDPPRPSTGFTEMSFGLTRIELTLASVPDSIRPKQRDKKVSHADHAPATASTHTAQQSSHQMSPRGVEGYDSYFESTFIKSCNPEIPIQRLTMLATKVGLCKLHVVDFMCRGVPASNLSEAERDNAFLKAIEMLEYDNAIYSTDNLRGFRWYTQLQIPFPGYIFLASELFHRTSGELCERAWQAICDNHEHRGLYHNLESPMHMAFGHALLKAWISREQAELQLGRASEPPKLVTVLRQRLSSRSKYKSPRAAERSADTVNTEISGSLFRESQTSIIPSSGLESVLNMPEISTGETADPMTGSSWFGEDQTDWAYLMQSGAFGGLFGSDGPGFT